MPVKKGDKKKVVCPACNTETELTFDEELDLTGRCGECGINLGAIFNRDRHEQALNKLREGREPNTPPRKKKGDWLGDI